MMTQGRYQQNIVSRIIRSWVLWALLCALLAATPALGQAENLIDRIGNDRMIKFETRLTQEINGALARYIDPSQYVLSVKVIWNKDIIPATKQPGLSQDKQKLPGFPIFVRAPGQSFDDEGAPPFVRMVVKVLLDETLPEYFERFVRKITPIVARFDTTRGDQVIVLKETFPVRKQGDEGVLPPPTLPERELMDQLGQPGYQQYNLPPQRSGMAQPTGATGQMSPEMHRPSPVEAAQLAYEDGRYQDALRIVQSAFQQSTNNQERSMYLGMEGSIYFTMNNTAGALAAWNRALVFDPANVDVQRAKAALQQPGIQGVPAGDAPLLPDEPVDALREPLPDDAPTPGPAGE